VFGFERAPQDFSIQLFYTICIFCSQMRPNAAKAETKKAIVNIERINDCIPQAKIAKNPFLTPKASALARLNYAPTRALDCRNSGERNENCRIEGQSNCSNKSWFHLSINPQIQPSHSRWFSRWTKF
jgi:hypothetical protein